MITMSDSIIIYASAHRVYEQLIWFLSQTENYKSWHPEHRLIKWLKGNPKQKGSICYAEENIGSNLTKLRLHFIEIIPDQLIRYRPSFPLNLIVPGNKFELSPIGSDGCQFSASGSIRISEKLFLAMSKNHAAKLGDTRKHMREEGEILKRTVEMQ